MKYIPYDAVVAAIEEDDNIGFCLGCGEEAYGVEPDAEKDTCDNCGRPQVYGAEQIMLMGATK